MYNLEELKLKINRLTIPIHYSSLFWLDEDIYELLGFVIPSDFIGFIKLMNPLLSTTFPEIFVYFFIFIGYGVCVF